MSYKERRLSPMPDPRSRSYDDRATFDRGSAPSRVPHEVIELQEYPSIRRNNELYEGAGERKSNIERGRGSQRSRGSLRSRGSHSSSPRYSAKPLEARIKNCCRLTIAFIFSNVGVCVLFVGYTIMGSFLFRAIEEKHVVKFTVEFERNKTLEKLWNITYQYNVMDFQSWNRSTSKIILDYRNCVITQILENGFAGNDNSNDYNPWSIEGGFLYSLTVVTTIGYGHITPKSPEGKVVTIVYAIFGMPVFLLYMANMGDILAKSLKWSYAKVCTCRQQQQETKYQPSVVWRSAAAILSPVDPHAADMQRVRDGDGSSFSVDGDNAGEFPGRERRGDYFIDVDDQVSIGSAGSWRSVPSGKIDPSTVNIPITVSLVILFALLYGGTELFLHIQDNWDALTSFYFCFISLTTIGFGDVVPGSSSEERDHFIYCALYLMFGLALLSMCFNLMQEEVVHKVTMCIKSVTFFKKRQDDET